MNRPCPGRGRGPRGPQAGLLPMRCGLLCGTGCCKKCLPDASFRPAADRCHNKMALPWPGLQVGILLLRRRLLCCSGYCKKCCLSAAGRCHNKMFLPGRGPPEAADCCVRTCHRQSDCD